MMGDSTTARTPEPPTTQAELLYQAQKRKELHFRANVALSWFVLLLILVVIFSGQKMPRPPAMKIMLSAMNWVYTQFIADNMIFIAGGLGETIRISLLAITFATILALLAALGRLSTIPPVYALSTFYVSLIRGTPLYLQIFFFFLALPQLGIILPGLWAGVIALGLNYGAYMSEIFRAGLASVGKGQREAAIAVGMTPGQTMMRIVLPQAMRFAIPPTGNEFIAMTKDSALVAATGFVHELMWRAVKVGRAQFHNLEALIMAAIFYWVMTILLSYLQSRLEVSLSKGDR
ncbi:MAG: amino acid ABC transporter permease [Chloroflexi bacterium]|nr:amino acid ABC transporter permease [Chloroflexota bacterium]